MRADTLRGQVGGVGPWKRRVILGPMKWHRAERRVPFGAQKSTANCKMHKGTQNANLGDD